VATILEDVCFCEDAYQVLDQVDALVIFTEWPEFKNVDQEKLKILLKGKVIIDGRNLFNLEEMRKMGIRYYSIGRPSLS